MSVESSLDGLKIALEGVTPQVYDHLPSNIVPPCIVLGVGPFSYPDMGDAIDYVLTVTVFASRADDRNGYRKLCAYIDPTGESSIKAAIDAAPTLPVDGVDHEVRVRVEGGEEIGVAEVAGTTYYAATFNIPVLA